MISLLDDLVIDQIAAGEVLENPSSAVKELVENALDAGAKKIVVEIEAGGLQRIIVDDDGSGMSKADALMCLKRHATSKIRTTEDLNKLLTMGFRGEALAAISAVTQFELKTSNGIESTRIHGGGVEVCARNKGTTIDARSLFYNTPARLKFQKSAASCAAAVLKTVETISLAHPEVGFRLVSNGKMTFQCEPSDWKHRVEEVLGSFHHEVSFKQGDVEIRGLLGRPEEAKLNRSGQTLFVNERPIQSPLISRAVKAGFGTRVGESLFPLFVLFVKVAPDSLDVNVHPQKREVRFRDEGKIFNLVQQAIVKALEKEEVTIPAMPWDFSAPGQVPFVFQEAPVSTAVSVPLPIKVVGREVALFGDFLLIEDHPWKWVDLRGAKARVLYEVMSREKPAIQPLLWPHEITLSPTDSAEEMVELLKDAAIEARSLGKRKLAVDAVAVGMETEMLEAFIQQFLANKTERRLAASLTRVCRASPRRFSFAEACAIWQQLNGCRDQLYDPLGKKISVTLSEEQIAELFS